VKPVELMIDRVRKTLDDILDQQDVRAALRSAHNTLA